MKNKVTIYLTSQFPYFIATVSVAFELEQMGRYEIRVIMHRGSSDFLITKLPKKSWKERFWWLIALATLVIGWFADIGKEALLRKQKQETQKSTLTTPTLLDTSRKK